MSLTDREADLDQTLHDRFGLAHFRAGQREVIEEVLRGRDVLCVMPTGGGKSLCYQLPAVVLPGVTLVVSPLIALMKDQVDALLQRGIRATLINSTLDPAEQRARILDVEAGRYDLVYVAPERFRSGRFVEVMAAVRPALLAIDEAHCISEWGHDFRPDYARIGLARKKLGSPPCIALTATATDLVRRDIADQLDLQDPAHFVTGFDRPNLSYAALGLRTEADKLAALARTLDVHPGPSIVYASSRARCEAVADHVRRTLKRDTVVYHAGLTREERTASQERFMSGEAEVVVATNAFGMGVDKPDIRSVIHYNMPGTLEAYYQEAGRAGRDGDPAHCLLFHAPGDRILQERFIDNEYPPPDVVWRTYQFLRGLDADPIELTQAEIKESLHIDLGEQAIGTAIKLLETAGAIERFLPRENMAIVRINPEGDPSADPGSLADRLSPQAHVQRIVLLGLEGLVNRRYSEPVYFHPDDLARSLGLDRPALGRALRSLTAELPIDYVPPFRGNALRVIDRERTMRTLAIDFAALDKRKQREYDKLERMVKYAQASRCRRSFLLGYFGDEHADRVHCGSCDNCGDEASPSRAVHAIDTPAGLEVLLKVLSGIARARGRFGKTMVAQMLKGSGSEKMDRMGLKKLTTFGILPQFAQPELGQIIDALGEAGYVESPEVDRFRPIVNLTESGWSLLKTPPTSPIPLALPEPLAAKVQRGGLDRASSPKVVIPSDDEDSSSDPSDPLYLRLKSLRTDWAREHKQPPYCIFNNQTLDEIARIRPRTPQALAAVKGFGPAKLERYGATLLQAIAEAHPSPPALRNEPNPAPARALRPSLPLPRNEPNPLPTPPPTPKPTPLPPRNEPRAVPKPAAPSTAYVPTEEWTWRLLERGFTPNDVAAIRALDATSILRHATLAARQGKPVDPAWFLPPDLLDRWRVWEPVEGEASPSLDAGEAELWALFDACRRPR